VWLQQRTNHRRPIGSGFSPACDSRAEAQYLEAYFATQYGLPTMVFHVRGRRMAITQQHVDRLYDEVDTRLRAKQLMAALLLFEEYPHHRCGAMTREGISRKILHFTYVSEIHAPCLHEHRIQLVSSDLQPLGTFGEPS